MRYRLRILTLMCAMLPCVVFWPSGPSLASPQNAQPGGQPDTRTRTTPTGGNNFDACSLLTGKEITDLLGEPLDALNPSARSAGNLNDVALPVRHTEFCKVCQSGRGDASIRRFRSAQPACLLAQSIPFTAQARGRETAGCAQNSRAIRIHFRTRSTDDGS